MAPFHTLFVSFVKSISVEPVAILAFISFNIFSLIHDIGFIRILCDRMFNENLGTASNNHTVFPCWDTKPLGSGLGENGTIWWHGVETILQQQATTISMITTMTILLPSSFSNIILSAYGDRKGRKRVMLLGLFGVMIMCVPVPIMFAWPQSTPFYTIFIITAIASFTGLMGSVFSSTGAYIADTVSSKEMITVRLTILTLCINGASVIGPLIGQQLLISLGYVWAALVATAIAGSAVICAMITVKQVKPKRAQKHSIKNGLSIAKIEKNELPIVNGEKNELSVVKVKNELSIVKIEKNMGLEEGQAIHPGKADPKAGLFHEFKEIVSSIPELIKDLARTVFKPREGNKRAYLFVIAFIQLFGLAAEGSVTSTVFSLFVQKAPLSMSTDEISYFRSMGNLIRLVGTAGGIYLLKNRLRMSDSLIIVLAIVSQIAKIILTIFSTKLWMLYVSVALGALDPLAAPCMQAFMAKTVEPDEIGKTYGAFHLLGSLSFIYVGTGAGAIYRATVATNPTLVFQIAAGLAGSTLLAAGWLHVDLRRRDSVK